MYFGEQRETRVTGGCLNEGALQFANHSNDLSKLPSIIYREFILKLNIYDTSMNKGHHTPGICFAFLYQNKLEPFEAQWLLCVPPDLTFRNSNLCPHSAVTCFIRLTRHTTFTGFYNRGAMCLLRGTDWIFIYNSTFCPHIVFMCFVWI